MDVNWLLAAGALMLLVGLGALAADALRRRSNPFPRILRDLTTKLLPTGVPLLAPTSPLRQLGKPHSARGLLSRVAGPRRRIVPVVFVGGLVAACATGSLYVATTLGTPQVAEGTAVIAYSEFQGAPREGSPAEAFASQLQQVATTSNLEPFLLRKTTRVVTSADEAEAERVRLGADALWWGEVGHDGAITASLVLAAQFRPWQAPWTQLQPNDLAQVILPTTAQVYLPAGQGVDPLVPFSLAIAHLKLGEYAEAARAAYGTRGTLGQVEERHPSGRSISGIQLAALLESASDLARKEYAEAAVPLDALEAAGMLPIEGLVNRAAVRLAVGDVAGVRSDADRVLNTREANNQAQALAYLARGRASLRGNDLAAARADLEESARLDPGNPATRLERAEVLYRQSQPDAARTQLQGLLSGSPNAAPAYRLLGLTMLMLGQPTEAMSALDRAEGLYNLWLDALRKEEASAHAVGDSQRGQWATGEIVALNKELAGIYLYQGMTWADLARQDPPESFLGGIWRRIRGEPTKLERAVERMRHAQRLDPQRPDVPLQLGNVYTQMGDSGSAAEVLQEAQRLDPSAPEPYMALAGLQKAQGNPKEATATLQQLLAQDPSYFPAYDEVYHIYLSVGDQAAATATLHAALQVAPRTTTGYLWRGRFLQRLGDAGGAIEAARMAATDPQLWEAHLLLAQLLAAHGQAPEALQEFKQALAIQPNNPDALLGAAHLHVLAGQAEEAQKLYERLVSIWPANTDGHLAFSQLLAVRGQLDRALSEAQRAVELSPERADTHFFLGQAYENKQQWSAAAEQYKAAAERDPERFDAFIRWARTLFLDDRYAESAEVSRKAIAMRATDAQGFHWLAEAQLAMGNAAPALEALAPALEIAPQDARLLALAAKAYASTGDEARAESFAVHAINVDPRGTAGPLALGELYLQKGRPESALQAFEGGLAVAPTSPDLLVGRGRAYAAMDDHTKAIQAYNEALKVSPNYAPAHLFAGETYVALGRWDEAFEQYRAAVQLRPNWPEGLNALGLAYLQRKDLPNAQAAFTKATQQAPGLVDAWFGLGLASRDRGQDQEAASALTKVVDLDARYGDAWLYLALTYEQLGQRQQAAEAFARAIETAQDPNIVEQAQQGLSRVK
ncbi:MAG: tetratricopeptide repeat protein [Chloroflexota bacterium]|nr:tetratricopeptide repeat protein [Chloroflexota bacterium]MDQ5865353.1 tetratricopeptide repeat protein [Chloroflexota bacterium]